jgi:hypothetical protein
MAGLPAIYLSIKKIPEIGEAHKLYDENFSKAISRSINCSGLAAPEGARER